MEGQVVAGTQVCYLSRVTLNFLPLRSQDGRSPSKTPVGLFYCVCSYIVSQLYPQKRPVGDKEWFVRQVSGDLMALALCADSCRELASCTSENSLTRCLQYRNVLNCIAANLENTQAIYENCPSQGMAGHYKVPGMVRAVEQRCRNCMPLRWRHFHVSYY